jgi:hypothetical protein
VRPLSAAPLLAAAALASALCVVPRSAEAPETTFAEAARARPLAFERNDGQTDERVRFVARGSGGAVFVTDDGLTLAARRGGASPLRMHFDGALARGVTGERRLPGVVNYVKGDDPSRWLSSVPLFARVVCDEVWPGVDVVFHGDGGLVEYDFEVAPHADVGAIGLRFDDADEIAVDAEGDLVVRRGADAYRHHRPRVTQDGRDIPGAFVVGDGGRIGFRVPGRDRTRPLVIDPVIAYATYLGGTDSESAFDVAVSSAGEAYLAGSVTSVDFPVANPLPGAPGAGSTDAFVTRLNASGASLIYSTYLGGGGTDNAWGIRVNASGIYVAGSTTSQDFPRVGGLQTSNAGGLVEGDAFVLKLAPNGASVIYSTYFGGTKEDACRGLAVDATGAVYVAGFTTSADLPTTPGVVQTSLAGNSDGWAAKIAPTGASLVWSTYFGGASDVDAIDDIAIGAGGTTYVAGYTASKDLPTAGGYQAEFAGGTLDGFVARLTSAGALSNCTYLGGYASDGLRRVAVDAAGNAYAGGYTGSQNFPTLLAVQESYDGGPGTGDGCVAGFDPTLATLRFSTFFGGRDDDDVLGLAISPAGEVFVTGNTTSIDLPVADAFQPEFGGVRDAFLAKLTDQGTALSWSTYYGRENYDAGTAVAVDGAGDAYIALQVGAAGLQTLCAVQSDFAGGPGDCYVVKVTDLETALAEVPLSPQADVKSPYEIALSWVDASRNECGFRVERSVDGGAWTTIRELETNASSLTDLDIEPDHVYSYRVIAVNAFGDSPPSAEAVGESPQTIVISQREGKLRESASSRRDGLTVFSELRFTSASDDRTIDPFEDDIVLKVGDAETPYVLHLAPADPGWKQLDETRYRWTSPKKTKPKVKIDLDLAVPSLTLKFAKLDFPADPAGDVYVSVRAAMDAGHTARLWTPVKKKRGQFKLP